MNFVEILLYSILAFLIMIEFLAFISIVFDVYYAHKEKHISKMLDVFAKAIKKMSEENKDA